MFPAAFMILIAPFIGSFLGALAIRIPEGRPVVWARSECENCRHVLSARELVPIVSFVWLKGRCRTCRAPIGAFPLVIELAALSVAAWAALHTSGPVFVASCAFGWALLLLAAIDWRVQLLPDVVTLPLMAGGLVAAFALPLDPWRDHAVGAASGFASMAAIAWFYHRWRKREGLGLGDAKLSAAIGAWIGWQGLPTMLLWGSMLGLLFAIALSLRGRHLRLSDRLPFGVFLAAGGWLVWLYGPLSFANT